MDAALKDNNGNMILPKTLKISDNQGNPKATNPKRQSYEKMIIEAISTLKERNGTSIPAIKKYISSVFLIPEEISRRYVAKFLKKSTEKGILLKVDKKYRYKLSANTIKEAQKKITKPKKIKKISKNENEKENIEPVAGKSSTLSNTEKTKIQKPKSVKKKNSKIEGEPKKPKPKKTKEGQSSSPKETKIKKTKVSTETKIKKMEIPKEVKTKKTLSTEENKDDPLKKKAKIEMNKVNNDLQIKVTQKKTKIDSNVKVKLSKTNNATIAAGNKLKKQARKSLIKLNMKKQKQKKGNTQHQEQQRENQDHN